MGHEAGRLFITGFGHMHLVPHPGGFTLLAEAYLVILGRANRQGGGGQLIRLTPTQGAIVPPRVILKPHPL
jgi:hypothetical protein